MPRLLFLRSLALGSLISSIVFPNAVLAQTTSPDGPTQPNIAPNCNAFYTVKTDDGCYSIEQTFKISDADFLAWNPDVSADCSRNFWAGYAYCVGVGPLVSTTTTSSSSTAAGGTTSSSSVKTSTRTTSSRITSAANTTYSIREPTSSWVITTTDSNPNFPPTKTQAGQAADCVDWRLVGPADTCANIIGGSTWMDETGFYAANPGVGADCSALWADWWVCVRRKPGKASYSFEFTSTATSATVPPSTAWTSSVYPTANSSFAPVPSQGPMPTDCREYYMVRTDETCKNVPQIAAGLVTEQQFFGWNPVLNGACNGLWLGTYYCAVAGESNPAAPSTTARPSAIQPGQVSSCNRWYTATGYETCGDLVVLYGTFSTSDFIAWNPSVGNDCGNIADGVTYCIGTPASPTSRTGTPSSTVPTSEPTQSGLAGDCSSLWLVSRSDTCNSIAKANGISTADFGTWNPAVGADCTGLQADMYVCVAVQST